MLQEEDDVDMVISDINMPQMDGLTLLEQIPKVDPNVRSIIISAYGDMKNIRTAMNRGAFDFVTKPLDFDDLQITIDRTLAHLVEWREALSSPGPTGQPGERAKRRQQNSAVDPPHPVSQGKGFRRFRQHGAGQGSRRGLLRRNQPGSGPHRLGHRRRFRQGRTGRPL